ncbi:MAG: hypothetical protein AAFZ07_25325 [Actinomycetota bacterium]
MIAGAALLAAACSGGDPSSSAPSTLDDVPIDDASTTTTPRRIEPDGGGVEPTDDDATVTGTVGTTPDVAAPAPDPGRPTSTEQPADDAASPEPTVAPPVEPAPTTEPPAPTPPPPEPEELADSWTVEVVRGLPNRGAVDVDAYVPVGNGPWPGVVVFGDAGIDPIDYQTFAVELAELGAVVVVGTYDPERPPDDSSCVVEAALEHAAATGMTTDRLATVGFGLGATVALGESLGGPWTRWSVGACERPAGAFEPGGVTLVAASLDVFGGSEPTERSLLGLSPFDQLGGNRYTHIDVIEAQGAIDPTTTELVGRFGDEGYDIEVHQLSGAVAVPGAAPTTVTELARRVHGLVTAP